MKCVKPPGEFLQSTFIVKNENVMGKQAIAKWQMLFSKTIKYDNIFVKE